MRKLFYNDIFDARFIDKGFVIQPMLNNEEIAGLLSSLAKLKPDDNFRPTDRSSDYHCTFLDTNEEYKIKANKLISEIFTPHINRILSGYSILSGNFYIKQPGSGKFEIHQNWTHTPELRQTTLTVWCPLVEVNSINGTIQIVPGSHKITEDIACVNVDYYFKNFEDILISKYLKPIDLKAGEAIIFDDTLIHYSGQNNSEEPRLAIQIETIPKEMTPVIYYFDKDKPELGFEVFEVDFDYFVKENVNTMRERPSRLKSLGFVKNPNKLLAESEFMVKMNDGQSFRNDLYRK